MTKHSNQVSAQPGALVAELTVTNLVFKATGVGEPWLTGLCFHQRLGGFLPACGHVEPGESLAQAALRETVEELGCETSILPGPAWPTPVGYPHAADPAPFWLIKAAASPDNHTAARHIHHDAIFASVFVAEVGEPESEVVWLTEQQVRDATDLSQDIRLQILALFPSLDSLTAGTSGSPGITGGGHEAQSN